MSAIDEIRQRIAESGLKAPTIENRSGHAFKRATFAKIINGETDNPGIDTVQAISRVLGLTVSQLIGEAEPPRQIQREPRTWDDLRDCLDALGIVDTESVLRLVKQLPRSKDLGKRQQGLGGKS